ncbi:MAG TPA: FtsX-like permease family protein [Gaiellaceae bacterium]|nr:FtsX-like permease family protein [Gaiellaceae bacterium]
MVRFALKGLLGRKLRTVLSALAIVLGVAMVAGTFMLTDSIDKAFTSIFTDVRQGSNAVISGRTAFDVSQGAGSTAPTLSEALLPKVRSLADVAAAEGSVDGEAQLIGRNGKAIVFGGAPNLGFSIANGDSRFNPLTLVEGSWPTSGQVVVDKSTADKKGLKLGQPIGVQAEGAAERLRISGFVNFGSVATIGGATLAGFDLPTAQRLFRKPGRLDEIAVAAKPGVSDAQLVRQLRANVPATAQVKTATQQAHDDAAETNAFITFLRGFLLAFGGIALFVGAFVIANSLSITIAQRTREFATARTIGASRRQILTSILLESLVVGVLASLVGLAAGVGLAKALFWLFDLVGFTLPNSGLILTSSAVAIALAAGILVTLVASLRPAFRATRVPPIAAVREGASLPPSRYAFLRVPASILLTLLGFGALTWGLFGPGLSTTALLIWMGVGALMIFLGVALLAERLVRPLATWLGWPSARFGGTAGRLARGNSQRNTQRTASTASALMIGLALVTLVSVLAAGIVSTFRGAVDDLWKSADYAVTAQNNFSPIPVSIAEATAKAPGVDAVGSVRAGQARAFGSVFNATAVDPPTSRIFSIDWKEGSDAVLARLGANGAFVTEGFAKDHHLSVGSTMKETFASGRTAPFRVMGIFKPPTGGSPFGPVTISAQTWDRYNSQPRNLYSFVIMKGGTTDANQAALDRRLRAFPNAKVQTRQQFVDNQISGLSSVLNVLYVLLALSVVVSLFGIVNTLVLTVFERTREIGMLRAVGMTRRQVRRMIRHESVITASIGGVLGIALGIALGALLVARVDFIDFTLPVGQLVVFAIAAIVVGLLAAIFPARRAARLNVLEALQYE